MALPHCRRTADVAVSLFGAKSASPKEQLGRLREQAWVLVKDRVEPAASGTAAMVAESQPIQQVLGLLPLVAEYGGLVGQVFRRVKGQTEKAVAPAFRQPAAWRWSVPLRSTVIAAAVLGVGYLAYRLSVSKSPSASRSAIRRSRARQPAG